MRNILIALALGAVPAGANAAMSVQAFLARAEALEKKGVGALFSSDLKLLKAEMQDAGKQLKAERAAATAAGRAPGYCPPAETKLNSKELLQFFRSIPAAEHARLSTKAALYRFMAHKFPCRS